jgi:peptide chain release factor 1
LIADSTADKELKSLAAEEVEESKASLNILTTQLKASLVPKHPFGQLGCLLELRPGAGGNEAAIFAGDLLRMYQAFCKRNRLRASIIKLEQEQRDGAEQIQEAILEIESQGAYDILRCEAGVHRVQRVPATEKQGRTHTSAVSVLVLPSFPENIADSLGEESFDDPNSDYYIDPKDVRTDVMRARGAGGQHVNTTDSAVRLTHIPTGTVVAMQDSRSQHKNRQKAWQILRSRLAQSRREAREEELAQMRLSVVGVAKMGRGDKIRTYNWGQQRVTDHRSGLTLHHLDDIMQGGNSLDDIMKSVRLWRMERDLEALAADEQLKNNKN